MMKTNLNKILIFTGLFSLISTGWAQTSYQFSPYADITINTYWSAQYQDMEPADLTKISAASGVKNFHLAFVTDAGTCLPAWGAQSSYSIESKWAAHLTNNMRENNINYIISFGGASGNDLSLACDDVQLVNVYENVIKTYQPQGLDFDIENGTANIPKIMRALKQIQNTYPNLKISFTLPVMPEGLTTSGQDIVKQAQQQNLRYSVNIMAMDYGPAYQNNMGQYAIQAANNLYEFLKNIYTIKSNPDLWQMIEVTPMIGLNDVNIEQFTLSDVDTLRDFAKQTHLGGLSMWSVARDNPCADQWASSTCSGKNLQTKANEFAMRFLINN
ncbi:MAG: hypothetical protein ACD_46C00039G0007 [uncultured bacterium]|nr:MAG: hypothetical protein ACD_46C00039G0007 [uncultured bacterium]